MNALSRNLFNYYAAHDLPLLRAHTSLQQTLSSAVFVFGIIPALCQWTAFQSFFQLDWQRACLFSLPFFAGLLTLNAYVRIKGETFAWWGGQLLNAIYFEAMLAAWVFLASAAAAPIMACMLVLTLCVHGQVHLYTGRYPYGPIAIALVVVGLLQVSPSSTHTATLAFATIAGVVASMLIGATTLRRNAIKRENDSLREAIAAEALARKHDELREVSQLTVGLIGQIHDARNALMAAKLQADCLRDELKNGEAMDRPLCVEITEDLVLAISQLEATVGEVRTVTHAGGAKIASEIARRSDPKDVVHVYSLLADTRASVGKRYTGRNISLIGCDGAEHLRVRSVGGEVTLRRVFENLLLNAVQGDGTRSASNVHISLTDGTETGWVEIVFSDDGPGFSDQWLVQPAPTIRTTKEDGSGIGLLTSDRLVSACGGTLRIGNREDGGARIVVRLLKQVNA